MMRTVVPLLLASCTAAARSAPAGAARSVPSGVPRSAKDVASAAEAMILGAFVADAAGMSLHWIYSQPEIRDLVGSGSPFFFSP